MSVFYPSVILLTITMTSSTPDEAEWPRSGHSTDPQAVEPESARGWHATLFIAMETPLVSGHGCYIGLGAPSCAVEALRHLGLPRTEELCLTVSFPIHMLHCNILYKYCIILVSVTEPLAAKDFNSNRVKSLFKILFAIENAGDLTPPSRPNRPNYLSWIKPNSWRM